MGKTSNDGEGGDTAGGRSGRGGRGRGRGGRNRGKGGESADGGEAGGGRGDATAPAATAASSPPPPSATALRATSAAFIPRSVTVPNRPRAVPPAPTPAPTAKGGASNKQKKATRPKKSGVADRADVSPVDPPADPPPDAVPKNKNKNKASAKRSAKGTGGRPDNWWKTITQCDPITLEPLADLDHPPFELRTRTNPNSPTVSHLFDPTCLAEWVTGSKQFENPLNRTPMDVDDCRRLDNHLKRCGLTKFSVHDAFVAAAHERQLAEAQRVARASETAEAAAARREREASELAASLFMSIRAREHRTHGRRERDRERGGLVGVDLDAEGYRRRRGEAFAADGAFAMVDDDEGMRGRRLGRAADETEWVWEDGSHLLYEGDGPGDSPPGPADDFPALGGAGVSGGAVIPSGSSSAPSSAPSAAFPSLASATGGVGGGWAAMAAQARSLLAPPSRPPVVPRVQSVPKSSAPGSNTADTAGGTNADEGADEGADGITASTEEDRAREERRKKLADAFGVSNPDARPSSFAASSAETFTKHVLATARAHPEAVRAMELALETMVMDPSKRRLSLDPMTRRLRAVAHAVGATYGVASCSYGDEPRRRVDYFRSENTGFPSVRLSDAVLVAEARSDADATSAGAGGDDSTLTGGGVALTLADARAARVGPAPGDPWFPGYTEHYSRGRWSRLEVRFTDFNDVHVALSAVREFAQHGDCAAELVSSAGTSEGALGGSGRWSEDMDLVVHFWKRSRYESAVGKLGGGIRGRFRATHAREAGPDPDPDDANEMDGKVTTEGDKLDATREALRAKVRAISGGRFGPSVPGAFGNPNKRRETPAAETSTADPWVEDSPEEWNELLDDVD